MMPNALTTKTQRIAVVSTYLLKRCGIVIFAHDLVNAMDLALQNSGETYVLAIAVLLAIFTSLYAFVCSEVGYRILQMSAKKQEDLYHEPMV